MNSLLLFPRVRLQLLQLRKLSLEEGFLGADVDALLRGPAWGPRWSLAFLCWPRRWMLSSRSDWRKWRAGSAEAQLPVLDPVLALEEHDVLAPSGFALAGCPCFDSAGLPSVRPALPPVGSRLGRSSAMAPRSGATNGSSTSRHPCARAA